MGLIFDQNDVTNAVVLVLYVLLNANHTKRGLA